MSILLKPEFLLESCRLEYEIGRQLLKSAGDASRSNSLSGELYLSESGWLMMRVPAPLLRGIFDSLDETGLELPIKNGKLTPHVSVMSPDEIESIGGADVVTERGHHFRWNTGPIKTVAPKGWEGISKVYYLTVESPELKQLRRSYGLPELRNGYDLHLTVALRRVGVLHNNETSKAAGYDDSSQDPRVGCKCPRCGSHKTFGARATQKGKDGSFLGYANAVCSACDNGFSYDFKTGETSKKAEAEPAVELPVEEADAIAELMKAAAANLAMAGMADDVVAMWLARRNARRLQEGQAQQPVPPPKPPPPKPFLQQVTERLGNAGNSVKDWLSPPPLPPNIKAAAQHGAMAHVREEHGKRVLVCPKCWKTLAGANLYKDKKGWFFCRACFSKGGGSLKIPESFKVAAVQNLTPFRLLQAFERVHPKPTPGQQDAGNYRKGHISYKGIPITIETAAGQSRHGVAKDGKPWSIKLKHAYGYIKKTESEADGDHIDVFVGDDLGSETVFVVNQNCPTTGKFDEHKTIVACNSAEEAKKLYHDNYSAGWTGYRSIGSMTLEQFKEWIKHGDTSKPFEGLSAKAASSITYEEESAAIRERQKTTGAVPHKFRAAVWTHKNGHPRCYHCGDEERTVGQCSGFVKAAAPRWVKQIRGGQLSEGAVSKIVAAQKPGTTRTVKPLGRGMWNEADLVASNRPQTPGLYARKLPRREIGDVATHYRPEAATNRRFVEQFPGTIAPVQHIDRTGLYQAVGDKPVVPGWRPEHSRMVGPDLPAPLRRTVAATYKPHTDAGIWDIKPANLGPGGQLIDFLTSTPKGKTIGTTDAPMLAHEALLPRSFRKIEGMPKLGPASARAEQLWDKVYGDAVRKRWLGKPAA